MRLGAIENQHDPNSPLELPMLGLNPYLNFPGTCEEAFKFYEATFGAKIVMTMTFGNSPMEAMVPAEWKGKVMHATMMVGDRPVHGSDAPPERYQKPQGISISLSLNDPAEAERIFKALETGGSVAMPLQQTFWAKRFGIVTDKFGIPWMLNCE
jgi:PhnB protein